MTSRDYCTAPHEFGPADTELWQAWAHMMMITHDQQECPDCRLWVIWTPKTTKPTTQTQQLDLMADL